jgi:hypothetical protein
MSYRMYLDEVGNDDMTHVDDERHRYLSLTGIVVKLPHVVDYMTPQLEALKRAHFEFDPDESLILHRKDIMNFKGLFQILRDGDRRAAFDTHLLDYLLRSRYTVITAVLDKQGMLAQQHWRNRHPYHYLMDIMVEKYAQFLERMEDVGDIMPEKRQGNKDKDLQAAFDVVRLDGTRYVSSQRICSAIPASKLKLREKADNVAGLQVCDLLAHPSYVYVRNRQGHGLEVGPFAQKIIPLLQVHKYDRSRFLGRIQGYGYKYLP